jgi:hypothetical protein
MSGVKHTPGPWFLEGYWDVKSKFDLGGWVSSNPPAGCPIFQLEPSVGTAEEIVANARLIAAAPDLLAALKTLCAAYDACNGDDHPAYALARAAIAKAEGGAA